MPFRSLLMIASSDDETMAARRAEVLESLELEDEDGGQGTIRVGRAAFQLLAVLLAENLSAPDFDPSATRDLLEESLLVRIPDAAARASTLVIASPPP